MSVDIRHFPIPGFLPQIVRAGRSIDHKLELRLSERRFAQGRSQLHILEAGRFLSKNVEKSASCMPSNTVGKIILL